MSAWIQPEHPGPTPSPSRGPKAGNALVLWSPGGLVYIPSHTDPGVYIVNRLHHKCNRFSPKSPPRYARKRGLIYPEGVIYTRPHWTYGPVDPPRAGQAQGHGASPGPEDGPPKNWFPGVGSGGSGLESLRAAYRQHVVSLNLRSSTSHRRQNLLGATTLKRRYHFKHTRASPCGFHKHAPNNMFRKQATDS